MPTKSKRSLMTKILAAIVALIVLVIAAITYGVLHSRTTMRDTIEGSKNREGSFCAEYGLPADDPRSNPDPLPEEGNEEGIDLHEYAEVQGVDSRYHVFTRGVDFSRSVGVVVRLHGDDAFEYRHPEGLVNCLAAVAASYNMMLVVPHTPDRETRTWWQDLESSKQWLSELLPSLERDYTNVDTQKTWWMGYSGGAEMISYGLLPHLPKEVTAGAIMIGGGGAPTDIRDPEPPLNKDLPLYWYVGSEDDGKDPEATFNAVEAANSGASWYDNHGYDNVQEKIVEGEDHFTIPQAKILDDVLREHA